MKILSWYVRGLGRPWVVRRLQHVLKLYNPKLIFLMEKKLNDKVWKGKEDDVVSIMVLILM